MRNAGLLLGILMLWAGVARADELLVVTNGAGIYYSNCGGMAFTDANGNYVFIGGSQGFVEVFYPNGTSLRFAYDPATHTFAGTDARGSFTATVFETLKTIHRGGGGGRGDGYPGTRTVVAGGYIDYLYHSVQSGHAPTDES